jgi:hypothetical protein
MQCDSKWMSLRRGDLAKGGTYPNSLWDFISHLTGPNCHLSPFPATILETWLVAGFMLLSTLADFIFLHGGLIHARHQTRNVTSPPIFNRLYPWRHATILMPPSAPRCLGIVLKDKPVEQVYFRHLSSRIPADKLSLYSASFAHFG